MRIPLQDIHLIAPRSFHGLTGGDFGAGVDSAGRTNLIPQLVPVGAWMISSVDGMAEKQNVTTLATRLSQRVASWESVNPEQVVSGIVGQDTETPASARAALTALAADHCHMYVDTCIGVDVQGLINQLVDQYTRWWNSAVSRYFDLVASGASHPMPGTWATPPPGYVPWVSTGGGVPTGYNGDTLALDFFGHPGPNPGVVAVPTVPDPIHQYSVVSHHPAPIPQPGPSPAPVSYPQAPASSPLPMVGAASPTSVSVASANAAASGTGLDMSWFSQQMIQGIPNAVLLVGGLAIAFFVFRGK